MRCPKCSFEMREEKKMYHYTECGLNNVFLVDQAVFVCPNVFCRVEMPLLGNAEALDRKVAKQVIVSPFYLHGDEITFLRKTAGLKIGDLADMFGLHAGMFNLWVSGHAAPSQDKERRLREIFTETIFSGDQKTKEHLMQETEVVCAYFLRRFNISLPVFVSERD